MKSLDNIVLELRQELNKYRNSKEYAQKGTLGLFFTNAIDIALNLTEIALFRNRPISNSEEDLWFKGAYHMNFEFVGGPWEHIYRLYLNLVDGVSERNFFRKDLANSTT